MNASEVHAAYAEFGASHYGRIVLGDLEARFGFSTRPMFDGDVNRTIHRDGSRAVLIHIARMMTTVPTHDEQTETET